jgi:inward rectifier potassium channel
MVNQNNTRKKIFRKEDSRELGLGSDARNSERMLNKDGNFNLRRTGQSLRKRISVYHDLIDMRWSLFFILIFGFYFIINLVFAIFYYMMGTEHLAGIEGTNEAEKFIEAFFFSAQSLTTVGYGRISPVGFWTSLLASFEAMVGLLGFAVITGLLYGKFTRPNARILFTKSAIIAPYKDMNALMFRIVNERRNQLLELEVQLVIAFNQEVGGKTSRVFFPLSLETSKINFFPLPWTLVHPINDESPMSGWDEKTMAESDAEFIILVKAYDDSFSQNVYRRYSYTYREVIWGAKYPIIWERDEKGTTILHMERVHETIKADLNQPGVI